ncbi:MAG TPA: heme exporter protein CcmD [Gammaproteobacteria bacterium]|nr:heme exporter protein CcmD [Gammaproteobacteria bacterium]
MSLGDFFHMGGYGLYVWGSYGMAVLLMTLEVWWLRQRRRTIVRRLGRINRMSAEKGRT